MSPAPTQKPVAEAAKAVASSGEAESYEDALDKGYIGERTDDADEDAYTVEGVSKDK